MHQQHPFGLRSLRLDVGSPDHLAPLFRFTGDEISEVGRRTGKGCATQIGKPGPRHRTYQGRVNFTVELADDLGGCTFRRTDAIPAAGLIAATYSPTVGTPGNASERVAVLTARARS